MSAGPSRPTRWVLVRLSSKEAASAMVGDLMEQLAEERTRRSLRWPRLWIEGQALRVAAALLGHALRHLATTARLIGRDGWRALRSSPRASLFSLAVLTLAIAAATVTFSVVDAVVLRPLPFADDARLFAARLSAPRGVSRVAAFEYLQWRDRAGGLADLAAIRGAALTLGDAGEARQVPAIQATANLFTVLGVSPLLGRPLLREDERPGAERIVVLSHRVWQQLFRGDPDVVNRLIGSGPNAIRIVGVMPPGFTFPVGGPVPVEAWLPLRFDTEEVTPESPGVMRAYAVVGRRHRGATLDGVRARLSAAIAELSEHRPDRYRDLRVDAVSLRDALAGDMKAPMLLALTAVLLVTLIACVNVANIALMRSSDRAREISLRASLGASRRQLMGAVLAEGLLLSIAASLLGVLISWWTVGAVRNALPEGIARSADIAVNLRVLAFALTVSMLTGLGFAAVPAWQSARGDLVALLKDGTSTVTAGRRRWRSAFLVIEIAFVSVLLITSALVVASYIRIVETDLGFERDRLITASLFGFTGTTEDAERMVKPLPGVASVGLIAGGPPPLISTGSAQTRLVPAGATGSPPGYAAELRRVSPEYFTAAAVPIVRGRTFAEEDVATGRALILDERAARDLFGTVEVVGQHLQIPGFRDQLRIVGVVTHVRLGGPELASGGQAYLPLARRSAGAARLVVRTTGDPHPVAAALRDILDRELPRGGRQEPVAVSTDVFQTLTARRRVSALVMTAFGLLAFAIGIAGVFGVVSSAVAQQRREFGVRIALGAGPARIVRFVLVRTGATILTGAAVGVPLAAAIGRAAEPLLFQTRAIEPAFYGVVILVLGATALGAALIPARRAARIDPLQILRA